MRTLASAAALLAMCLAAGGPSIATTPALTAAGPPGDVTLAVSHAPAQEVPAPPDVPTGSSAELNETIQEYCVRCHNDRTLRGNLSLATFDVSAAHDEAEVAERMIVKLRAGMMPPPGATRPDAETLETLAATLETVVDSAAASRSTAGSRRFQRLNRAEYERVIRDLLALDIDASRWLPADTYLGNFDNMSAAQGLSTTLLEAYMRAASEVSRLAVGNRAAVSSTTKYTNDIGVSQHAWDRVEGTPFGTRGGMVVTHHFPADGEYVFAIETLFGSGTGFENLDISIDGEGLALLALEHGGAKSVTIRTEPILVRAGQRRVSAAFVRRIDGPYEDRLSPHEWSFVGGEDSQAWANYGITALPHLSEMLITGPERTAGLSETTSRQRIFTCRPATAAEERPCAESIVERLARQAYRRPVTAEDLAGPMSFYDLGASEGGFELGVRTALQAILASPSFIFRLERLPAAVAHDQAGRDEARRDGAHGARGFTAFADAPADVRLVRASTARSSAARRSAQERPPADATPGPPRLTDVDLASRLAFFLWATVPDAELLGLAEAGRLSDDEVLEAQVWRMLEDPRSEALATRFASQWLRLQDTEDNQPEPYLYPDFTGQLREDLVRETQLFFDHLVRDDRSLLELFTADYTFLNERLARHYGIDNVAGDEFRQVSYPDEARRGILGHGSVLLLTSMSARTSPVLRGKWVMEVLMGTPPPPPPPNVPAFEDTEGSADGRLLTTRERLEMHRANPTCRSCHRFMDPIGLALDGYDVTGRVRTRENGVPLDTRGTYYDGTDVSTPAELVGVLMKRPTPLVRNFTANLLAYAIGRRVEYFDQPEIREIVREAARSDYRLSSFILGVVRSDPFQLLQSHATAGTEAGQGN